MHRVTIVSAAFLVAWTLATPGASAEPPPDKDAFASSQSRRALSPQERDALRAATRPGTRPQMEDRLGVPTTLWATRSHGKPDDVALGRGASREVAAAKGHFKRLAGVYGLSAADVDSARAASVLDRGSGPVIVELRQRVGGVPVFRERASILMTRDLGLVGIGGYLSPSSGVSPTFALDADEAVAVALGDLLGEAFDRDGLVPAGRRQDYEHFGLDGAAAASHRIAFRDDARAQRVMYRLPEGLVPAYYAEVSVSDDAGGDPLDVSYVVGAAGGRVLSRADLTDDASGPAAGGTPFSYRVWADAAPPHTPADGPQGTAGSPHPTGLPDGFEPPFTAPGLVTLAGGPIATGDPWLPADATETTGNNVEAYADLAAPDGFDPGTADRHASTTAARAFDRVYDTAAEPRSTAEQTEAAVTQLFYTTNFLHDWFYDAGFDEASGNAQEDNFGRGGLEGDSMRAEAEASGRNNANMSTPADGARPRMQQFVWDGRSASSLVVHPPSDAAGTYPVGVASFGPSTFDRTGDLVLVDDGVEPRTDGCDVPFANAAQVAGRIALIDRGSCPFAVKARNAQDAGAIGVVIANNTASSTPPGMGGTDASVTTPALSVTRAVGDTLKAALEHGPVSATMARSRSVARDSAIDNQVIAHEFGHYLHHRLRPGGGGVITGGLSEGWSDFVALLMTVREDDVAGGTRGAFPVAGYAGHGVSQDSYYFGIRRVPYSTDPARNALSFRHIANGEPLPAGVPTAPNGGPNAQVHNTGEVWATMLWECYAALLDGTHKSKPPRFADAQARMRDYLVAGLKLTPPAPTLLEARDALLMVAYATDKRDFAAFWEAFARRGAGTGAVAPDRDSATNSPVTESTAVGGALDYAGASLRDDLRSCDGRDGFVDNGESGRLSISLRNVGAMTLRSTTATVTTTNPHVRLGPARVTFPAMKPFAVGTGSVRVSLEGATDIEQVEFTVRYDDPALDSAGPATARFVTRVGASVVPDASATDDVESPSTPWTTRTDVGSDSWTRETSADSLNTVWHGPDPGSRGDLSLVSPPLEVGAEPLSVSFRHRHAFEAPDWDGGVIELSEDNGQTWTDVGTGYTGVITTISGNPLGGRAAFLGESPGYPAMQDRTLDLGTTYAGETVRLRFRIGADEATGGPGWDIDDIEVTGITNTPFTRLVADPGCR